MSFINTNFLPKRGGFISGNLGIGTDSTSYNLEVVGDINFTGTLYQNGTEFVSGEGIWTSNNDSTIYYLSSNVGIGITNPTQTLEVSGNIKSTNYISDIDTTNTSNILGNIGINILNVTNPGTPEAQWGVSVDGTDNDAGFSVAVDIAGNVYLSGNYGFTGGGSATIYNSNDTDSGLTLRATSGNNAAFVVKYNSSGIAQWAVSLDSISNDNALAVAVDSYGNVYLSGLYDGTATIYNANNTDSGLTLRDPGTNGAFVVKYNSSGIAQWAASVDSSGYDDFGRSIAVDADGNVYLGGNYNTNAATIYNANNEDSGLTLRATSGSTAAFVVKYNSSGIAQWAASVDSSDNDQGFGLAVDANGNVYLAGQYGSGSATIYNANNTDSGLTLRATSGNNAAFVIKYNSSGIAQWAASVDSSDNDEGYGLAVDADGNVYLAGNYGDSGGQSVTIYDANNVSSGLTLRATSGNVAIFLVKYNSSGEAQWAVSVDSTSAENARCVAVDAAGNVYLSGEYGSTDGASATIYNANDTDSGKTLRATSGDAAAFVVKYNSSGVAQWGVSVDSTGNDLGQGVAVDTAGNVYLGGRYGTAAAATIYNANNASSGLTLRVPSDNAAYVVKYSQTNMRFKLLNYSSSENDGTIKNIVNTTPYRLPVDIYSSDGTTVLSTIYIPPNSSREYLWYNNAWMLLNY